MNNAPQYDPNKLIKGGCGLMGLGCLIPVVCLALMLILAVLAALLGLT